MNILSASVMSFVYLAGLCLVCPHTATASDEPVNITHDLPYAEVLHKGKPVRIQRNPDTLNTCLLYTSPSPRD